MYQTGLNVLRYELCVYYVEYQCPREYAAPEVDCRSQDSDAWGRHKVHIDRSA